MIENNDWRAIIAIFLLFCCDRTSSECVQLTACSCMNEDGSGFDLSSLKHSGFLEATGQNNTLKFYFHPCENYKNFPPINQTNDCSVGDGVSLCMRDMSANKSISLGTAAETTMTQTTKNPELTLKHGAATTTIELTCCEGCTAPIFTSIDEHRLVLSSSSACKVILARGISTGSILVIIFFVFSGVYFIGGAIAIKLLKGATGWQMLPNHEFWLDLPSLVKEGVEFTFNRCKTDSYDRI